MTRIIGAIVTIILMFSLSFCTVNSHPGRTDANGGHWNHSTGEYHYHTGEYAGKNNSSSSSSTTKDTNTTKESVYDKLFEDDDSQNMPNGYPVKLKYSDDKLQKNHPQVFIFALIIVLLVGIWAATKKKRNSAKESQKSSPSSHFDISMIPDHINIDEDMLPYVINRKYGYGKQFNAFVTPHSKCYHLSKCPAVRNKKKAVMHRYIAMRIYTPCSLCSPKCEVDDWYKEFLKKNSMVNNNSINVQKTSENIQFEQLTLYDD